MSQHAREALAKLEHLVVQDIFLTETAKYADVVLPASASPEKDRHRHQHRTARCRWAARRSPLPGDARQDLEIIQEIARRIGLELELRASERRLRRDGVAMPSLANITWERLEREHSRDLSVRRAGQAGTARSSSATVSRPRRARQVRPGDAHPARRGARCGIPDGVDHRAPARALAYRLDDAAVERARRDRAGGHGMPLRARPERLGASTGHRVRVSTRRGKIELKARADGAIPPGMMFIPFCYAEAAANILTNPQLDPFGKIPGI